LNFKRAGFVDKTCINFVPQEELHQRRLRPQVLASILTDIPTVMGFKPQRFVVFDKKITYFHGNVQKRLI
jgi:hypothetical protein